MLCLWTAAESVDRGRHIRWEADPGPALIKHKGTILSFVSLHALKQGLLLFCRLVLHTQSSLFSGSSSATIHSVLRASSEEGLQVPKAHRLSLRAWQPSHTLTGWSQPREGTGLMCVEQGPHTPCPQALQWCLDIVGVKGLEHWWHWVMSASGTQ